MSDVVVRREDSLTADQVAHERARARADITKKLRNDATQLLVEARTRARKHRREWLHRQSAPGRSGTRPNNPFWRVVFLRNCQPLSHLIVRNPRVRCRTQLTLLRFGRCAHGVHRHANVAVAEQTRATRNAQLFTGRTYDMANEPRRVRTGIPGFDDVIRGGLVAIASISLMVSPAPARPRLPCSICSRECDWANAACTSRCRSQRGTRLQCRSHGWSLDGVEIVEVLAEADLDGESGSHDAKSRPKWN